MSKIYEALRQATGELAETTRPLFPAAPVTQEQAPPRSEPAPAPASRVRVLPMSIRPGAPIFPMHSRAMEQYKIVRTKLVQHPLQPRLILISSPESGDGKSITSLNVAGALALKRDVNVLILDGDLCRSSIATHLGLPSAPGLVDVLSGTCTLDEAVVRVEQFQNLYVLPAGERGQNRTELLDSPRWKAICAAFREQFRFTIMDAPPIAAVADYDLIQEVCDGVIVVIRPDHTNRTLCAKALETVTPEKLIGAVINAADYSFLRGLGSYRYYGYYHYNEAQ